MSDLTANNLSKKYKTGFLIILLGNFENVTQCSTIWINLFNWESFFLNGLKHASMLVSYNLLVLIANNLPTYILYTYILYTITLYQLYLQSKLHINTL